MADNHPSDALLQKLCDLQQQQLDKLDKVSGHLSQIAAEGRRNHDAYQAQLETYERDRKASNELAESHQKSAAIIGFLIMAALVLIAAAVLISPAPWRDNSSELGIDPARGLS
jgi:hypothetical protein